MDDDETETPQLTEEEIVELIEELDIDLEAIRYVTLFNGHEFVGELFSGKLNDKKENTMMFLNAYKIAHDKYLDFDGIPCVHSYFTDFSNFSDDPFVEINKKAVDTISKPSKDIISLYLNILKKTYLPDESQNFIEFTFDFSLDDDSLKDSSNTINNSNIIDFSNYRDRKQITYI